MTDRIWTPRPRVPDADLDVTEDGYVMRKVDRTMPLGETAYRIKPEDLLLAMARMSRDGKTREQIRKELDIYYYVTPSGISEWVDDATFDRALARARALLDRRIAQGLEPEETVTMVRIPLED